MNPMLEAQQNKGGAGGAKTKSVFSLPTTLTLQKASKKFKQKGKKGKK